jgi:Uma2 family endonuclease
MTVQARTVTADELLRMPDDGFRYELVRGELRKMAPAGHTHGRTAMRGGSRLDQHVEAHDLGVVYAADTGFLIGTGPDTVRAPDVAFVSRDRLGLAVEEKGYFPGPPDLAIEVVSPGDTYSQVEEKASEWLDAGTRMVLAADPHRRTVTRYRGRDDICILDENDVIDGEDVVPGWTLPVRELFA